MPKITSFQATVYGSPKELFYVLEKKNEGLTIIPRHYDFYHEYDSAGFQSSSPYVENRISVHPTERSLSGNMIHRTVISKDKAMDSYIWTDAIKKRTGFTPIFFKICSNMQDGFNPKRSGRIIQVANYKPGVQTLCYSVWVGAPDRKFELYKLQIPSINGTVFYSFGAPPFYAIDFYVIDAIFKRFRLTLLASYISAPSTDNEVLIHLNTFSNQQESLVDPLIARHTEIFIAGRNENFCALVFGIQRMELLRRHFNVNASAEDTEQLLKIVRCFPFPPFP
jgi:hypothetical protein